MKAILVLLLVALFAVACISANVSDGTQQSLDMNANLRSSQSNATSNATVQSADGSDDTVVLNNTQTTSTKLDSAILVGPEVITNKTEVVESSTHTDLPVAPTGQSTNTKGVKEPLKTESTVSAAAVVAPRVSDINSTTVANLNVTINGTEYLFSNNVTSKNLKVDNNNGTPALNFTCYYIESCENNNVSIAQTNAAIAIAKNVTQTYPNQFVFNFRIFLNDTDFALIQSAASKAFPANSTINYNPFFVKGCNFSNQVLIGNFSQFEAAMTPFTGSASSLFSSVVALSAVTVAATAVLFF